MTIKRSRIKSSLPRVATITSYRPGRPPGPDKPGANGDETAGQASAAQRTDEAEIRARAATRTTTSKRRIQRRVTPLEVLQQPIQAGWRKVFDLRLFLLVLGLTSVVLVLPTPTGLSLAGHRALALFIFTGTILALEPAPLPIAALLVPVAQIALGIDTTTGAFAPFGTPVVFLILGSLFLAEALRKHGLTRRLALHAIVRSGGRFNRLLLALMLIAGGLSMWVLNTATAAVLIPVVITIAQQVKRPEDGRKALTVLILAIGYSSSIGAMATIMGSGENAIASGLLGQIDPSFGFLQWMQYGLPIVLILLPIPWLILPRLFRLPNLSIDTEPAERELERLGGFSGPEREILVVLGISVTLWISGSSLESLLGLPQTLLSSAVVAVGAVALLSIEEVVDWNDLKGVNWGVFFVIGAGLTLGDALDKTGASGWFAGLLAPMLEGLPYTTILLVLLLLAFVLTQFLNNVPLGAIFSPLLITLGAATGIDPVRLVIPTVFVVALAFTLPAGSARMTLIAVTGAVSRTDMIRSGLLLGIMLSATVWLFFVGMSSLGWI